MKKVLITFLIIVFNHNLSFADIYKKITVEEVEDIFFNKITWQHHYWGFHREDADRRKKENYKNRIKNRGVAKCLYNFSGDPNCKAKLIKAILSYPDKSKTKRPGDIFYVFDAIEEMVHDHKTKEKFIKRVYLPLKEKPKPGMFCEKPEETFWFMMYGKIDQNGRHCYFFKKGTSKKIAKLKKDPSNEKVLGHKLIDYVKLVRMVLNIRQIIGTRDSPLLGDLLNLRIQDVKKNKIEQNLIIRKKLLQKLSLVFLSTKKNLDDDDYNSIDKNVKKLSKKFEILSKLKSNNNDIEIIFDNAMIILFDLSKYMQKSLTNAKTSKEQKNLSYHYINIFDNLINLILEIMPDKYTVVKKSINQNFFDETDRSVIKIIIKSMNRYNEKKCKEFFKSVNEVSKVFKINELLNKLKNIGIENKKCASSSQEQIADISQQLLLEKDWGKEIIQNIDKSIFVQVSDTASDLAKEVISSQSTNKSVSAALKSDSGAGSILDKKFGEVTLKQLIGASRR